mmetsp:Transcript_7191/g.9631  ORF Transcript_7191/g.9631 Transcript_7191/m.9631 type:complete len:117 (-) Transcript_7191:2687-3037(-)
MYGALKQFGICIISNESMQCMLGALEIRSNTQMVSTIFYFAFLNRLFHCFDFKFLGISQTFWANNTKIRIISLWLCILKVKLLYERLITIILFSTFLTLCKVIWGKKMCSLLPSIF